MYVYPLAKGVDKIFWTTVLELHNAHGRAKAELSLAGNKAGVDYYDLVGLVHNPRNEDGKDWKKLSYYSYKLMTEKLEGSDWSRIETVKEGENGVYAYKFVNTGTGATVFVVWAEK